MKVSRIWYLEMFVLEHYRSGDMVGVLIENDGGGVVERRRRDDGGYGVRRPTDVEAGCRRNLLLMMCMAMLLMLLLLMLYLLLMLMMLK